MEKLLNFSIAAVVIRLLLAVELSGLIGIERESKGRAAGIRTYMFVGGGAALAMLIGEYELYYYEPILANLFAESYKIDVTRIAAQVINGIGFLGIGTIIFTNRKEVKGLTTAAGLWTVGCMGLSIGAGFYLCAALAFAYVLLVIKILPLLEQIIAQRSRRLNLQIEIASVGNLRSITETIEEFGCKVLSVSWIEPAESMTGHLAIVIQLLVSKDITQERLSAYLYTKEDVLYIQEN